MPRVPFYTLAWSPVTETYELYQTRDREGLKILPESPAWFAWLEQVSSFAFVGKSGRYSARKEAKQRGDRYWSAYLTTGTQLTKKYLGKTADLKLARLEHIAGVLGAQSEVQIPPPVTLAVDTNSRWMPPNVQFLPRSLIRSIHCCQPSCMCHAPAHTWCPALTSLSDSSRA